MIPTPFYAKAAGSTLSATTSNQRTRFNVSAGSDPAGSTGYFYNAGPDLVFLEFGVDTVVAAVGTSIPLPAGTSRVLTVHRRQYVGYICPASTATVYTVPGEGF